MWEYYKKIFQRYNFHFQNPEILLLDEATRYVEKIIKKIFLFKASFMASHDLPSTAFFLLNKVNVAMPDWIVLGMCTVIYLAVSDYSFQKLAFTKCFMHLKIYMLWIKIQRMFTALKPFLVLWMRKASTWFMMLWTSWWLAAQF